MRKWLLLFVCCLSSLTFALPIQEHRIDLDALYQLTTALGIPEDADIVSETQKRWLRKSGLERWETPELQPDQRSYVLTWAQKQGLFTAWKPLDKNYDQALIFGATTPKMVDRIDYLKELWDEGIRFSKILWLLGDRPLDNRVDDLTNRCRTESEAARILWEKAILPEEMRHLPVNFIDVPMKVKGSCIKRPNTEDTIIAWLKTEIKPCKALFISSQPFCGYQYAIVKHSLPVDYPFDVVGPGVNPMSHPAAAAITLDAIARWIYQESL